jgi:metal-responsive CopG/Arc/MetJ family transcriptional regulator
MSHRRTHIVIPEDLAAEIDEVAGKRGRSQFLIQSARREISRHRMIRAISQAAGAWKDEHHPELQRGADRHVTKLRREAAHRLGARRSPKK